MSSLLLVPADDSQPIALYELESGTVYAQARQLFGVLQRWCGREASTSWRRSLGREILVDDNGHAKGLWRPRR
jgi:hypothetical protein